MPSSHLILCCPLLFLPPIPPSIRIFSNELTLRMRWPKYWSFSFSIIPSKEHPGLISFRTDWLDLLAVQGTLQSLLQYHSLKALILRRSALEYITCLQKFRQWSWVIEPDVKVYEFRSERDHWFKLTADDFGKLFNCFGLSFLSYKTSISMAWI